MSGIDQSELCIDGSLVKISTYHLLPNVMDEFISRWQDSFAQEKQGISIVFALANKADNSFIWAARYENEGALANRDYLGASPDLARLAVRGTVTDAVLVAARRRTGAAEPIRPQIGLARKDLTDSALDVEYKRYVILPDQWKHFFATWRRVVELREKAGFRVLFALADQKSNVFTWAVAIAGDFRSSNSSYLTGSERKKLTGIEGMMSEWEIPHMTVVPLERR